MSAATATDLSRVTFIVLREMRRPIITLIVVYAISVLGMVLIPGPKIDGETQYMSIFHAFYFMTYTATTTGFGEIPFTFSNGQRLWAIICLYVSVITWFYAIGSIVQLLQNPFFVRALAEWRFSRNVNRIVEDFYIICGFGDTGSVLTRGLSESGMSAVIIDADEERIKALQLRNYSMHVPGLCADASVPRHLLEAGLQKGNCRAVVAITNNEEVNLKISALARLLNPQVDIITMSKVEVFEETLATLGGEVHIVDPFKTFAKVLAASMLHPGFYTLNKWLVGEKGATLDQVVRLPKGQWIICGYGRMGHEVNYVLAKNNIRTAVIDPHENKDEKYVDRYIVGRSTARTLTRAGIKEAVGILAGTDDDGHNLGILLNARTLNPGLFSIVRQNRHINEVAFNTAQFDMIMQPSLVTARRILFLLIAPLLKPFFQHLLENKPGRAEKMDLVIDRLRGTVGSSKPHLVTIVFNEENSKAVMQSLKAGRRVVLGDLLKNPDNRERSLDLVVFVVKSGERIHVLPDADYEIRAGDQLLYCGTVLAKRLFNATLNNEYKLHYVQTGVFLPRSYVAQWYRNRFSRIDIEATGKK